MRWSSCKEQRRQRERARWAASYNWQRWFAWYPTDVGSTTVWLETIEWRRVSTPSGCYLEHRFTEKPQLRRVR